MDRQTFPEVDVRVTLRGHLPGAEDYAIRRVLEAQRLASEPVLAARVKLVRHTDPAVDRPIVAQANLNLRGRLIRAQASGISVTEAVDLMHDRLRRRLEKSARHWEARRGHQSNGEGWRHGQLGTPREPFFPRPVEDREIVRHKTFSLARVTVDQAAAELESMDYDFHLFTETGTERESVLYRTDDGYRLAQVEAPQEPISAGFPLTVSAQAAVRLTVPAAIERLNLSGQPFLFFVDPERERGEVLYHRYDGHYGLITPADI